MPQANQPQDPAGAIDERIRARLLVLLDGQPWWNADTANVWVKDGVVIYQGLRGRLADRRAAFRIAEQIPEVCAVRDHRVVAREWQAMA